MELFEYFSIFQLAIMLITIVLSYIIFGMIGFGTALIAGPILLNFLSLSQIIPLLALLDMFAASVSVVKNGKEADFCELRRLIPLMFMGSCLGVFLLMRVNPSTALLAFAIFSILYALYFFCGLKSEKKRAPGQAIPFGLLGGFFGTIFGSGGFLYALYLTGRIDQPEKIRITQTTLIGCSTLFRLILFSCAGFYFAQNMIFLALLFIPSMLIGSWIGKNISLRLSKQQFLKIINMVILISGMSMLIKFILS